MQKVWALALTDKIIEITKHNWMYWYNLEKKQGGIKTINGQQLTFFPHNYCFSADEKVIVFRFNSQKGRIIGFKDEKTYQIIGFDVDYSAYKHE